MSGICDSAVMLPADWEQLVSVELEATRVPIFQKKSSHTIWKCRELPRRFSTLPAAGAAVRGLVPLLLALLGGLPAGQGEKFRLKQFTVSGALQCPEPRDHCLARRRQAVGNTDQGTSRHASASSSPEPMHTLGDAFPSLIHHRTDHSRAQSLGFMHQIFLLFWKEIFTEPTTYFPTLCRRVNQTQGLTNTMRSCIGDLHKDAFSSAFVFA